MINFYTVNKTKIHLQINITFIYTKQNLTIHIMVFSINNTDRERRHWKMYYYVQKITSIYSFILLSAAGRDLSLLTLLASTGGAG